MIFKSDKIDKNQGENRANQVSVACLIPLSKIEYWQSGDCHYYSRNVADIDIKDMLSVISSELFNRNVTLIKIASGVNVSNKSIQSFGDQLLGYCRREIEEADLIEFCHFLMRESRWEDTEAKLLDTDHYHGDMTDGGISRSDADMFLAEYKQAIHPLLCWINERRFERRVTYETYRRQFIEMLNIKMELK